MTPRAIAGMLLRMALVFLVMTAVSLRWPGFVLRPLTPVIGCLTQVAAPYLDALDFHLDDATLQISGELHPRMTQADGSPVPAAPGTWNKQAGPTLQIIVLALAVWAAPAVAWRRRAPALLVTLAAAVLICGFHLSVEIQEAALRHMGQVWLPHLSLAGTEANVAYFKSLEVRFRIAQWIKSFHDGGGALFLGVWAGLIGYAVPVLRGRAVANADSL